MILNNFETKYKNYNEKKQIQKYFLEAKDKLKIEKEYLSNSE